MTLEEIKAAVNRGDTVKWSNDRYTVLKDIHGEFKRVKGGDLPPNKSEQWLDCQARALSQAAYMVFRGEV